MRFYPFRTNVFTVSVKSYSCGFMLAPNNNYGDAFFFFLSVQQATILEGKTFFGHDEIISITMMYTVTCAFQ